MRSFHGGREGGRGRGGGSYSVVVLRLTFPRGQRSGKDGGQLDASVSLSHILRALFFSPLVLKSRSKLKLKKCIFLEVGRGFS